MKGLHQDWGSPATAPSARGGGGGGGEKEGKEDGSPIPVGLPLGSDPSLSCLMLTGSAPTQPSLCGSTEPGFSGLNPSPGNLSLGCHLPVPQLPPL